MRERQGREIRERERRKRGERERGERGERERGRGDDQIARWDGERERREREERERGENMIDGSLAVLPLKRENFQKSVTKFENISTSEITAAK